MNNKAKFSRKRTPPGKDFNSCAQAPRFGAAYFRKFYLDAKTRVVSPEEMRNRAAVIVGVLRQAQIPVRRILDAGIQPSHLDTHKHTHLLPPVLEAVARIGEVFRIPWVRRPFDLPMSGGGVSWGRRLVSQSFGLLRRRFHRVLSAHGCRTTDHFAGFQITGNYDGAELARLIRILPDGVTEFMCHPGFCTDELRGERTRLKESRQKELEALRSPEVRQALCEANCQLVSYAQMEARG